MKLERGFCPSIESPGNQNLEDPNKGVINLIQKNQPV